MFYAKEIEPALDVVPRGGEHIFFTLSCGPGWLIGITIWNIKELRFTYEKVRPADPFHRKTGLFSPVIAIRLE